MKKIILRTLILAAIALGGSTLGFGQLTGTYSAKVPFDFSLKSNSMKAGEYRIRPVLTGSGLGYLEIIDVDHNRSRVLSTAGMSDYVWDANAPNTLTFINDNGHYTLASINTKTFRKSIPGVTASAQVITKNTKMPAEVVIALN